MISNSRFGVTVGNNHAKGIHLRYAEPVPKEYLVVVDPVFLNEKEIGMFSLLFFLRFVHLLEVNKKLYYCIVWPSVTFG